MVSRELAWPAIAPLLLILCGNVLAPGSNDVNLPSGSRTKPNVRPFAMGARNRSRIIDANRACVRTPRRVEQYDGSRGVAHKAVPMAVVVQVIPCDLALFVDAESNR